MRFTVDGSRSFEDRIANDLAAIRGAVLQRIGSNHLSALVLGGGYGRGEGGVYIVDGEERAYNDYDFFVIVPYRSRLRRNALAATLAQVKAAIEPHCGIHVDFSPPMPISSLTSLPYELMFMELKAGHHVVIGSEGILAAMPDYDMARPPLEECARLFMNRGVGLLLARQKLAAHGDLCTDDYEFIVRNIRKAQLAMGDSVLFLQQCYSPSYLERLSRFRSLDLKEVPNCELLRRYYEEAMAFKLRPNHEHPPGHTLFTWHEEVAGFFSTMFLWFEQQRLADTGLTWPRYRQLYRRLPSSGFYSNALNVVRNIRIRTMNRPRMHEFFLHPRDRVLALLPAVLFEQGGNESIEADIVRLWQYCG